MTVEAKKAWRRIGYLCIASVVACASTAKYSEMKYQHSKTIENKNVKN